jgi:hypothetical protein
MKVHATKNGIAQFGVSRHQQCDIPVNHRLGTFDIQATELPCSTVSGTELQESADSTHITGQTVTELLIFQWRLLGVSKRTQTDVPRPIYCATVYFAIM